MARKRFTHPLEFGSIAVNACVKIRSEFSPQRVLREVVVRQVFTQEITMKYYTVAALATIATASFAQFMDPGLVSDAERKLFEAQEALPKADAEFENAQTNVVRAQDALQTARDEASAARAARSAAQRALNDAQTMLRRAKDLEKRATDKGLSVADYVALTYRQEAESVGMTVEEWTALDMEARLAKFRERDIRSRAEVDARDTAAAEAAGMGLEEYRAKRKADGEARRLAGEAKFVGVPEEEWIALDEATRRERVAARQAEIQAEKDAKDTAEAEAAGITLEEFRARRKAEGEARRMAHEAKMVGLTVEEWTALDPVARHDRLQKRQAEMQAEKEAAKTTGN